MSEALQLNLPEDEKKFDEDDDVLSTDAKAAALATSALRMAEEAKRAAELLAEVKATLRENRIHPEMPRTRRTQKTVSENDDRTELEEVPFLGDAVEKDADSSDYSDNRASNAAAKNNEKIAAQQWEYQRFESLSENDFDAVRSEEKASNVREVVTATTQQPTDATKSRQDDDDAESNRSIETEDWPDDEGGVNASAKKAAIAEVSRRLAELEARQEAMAATTTSNQNEPVAEQEKIVEKQASPPAESVPKSEANDASPQERFIVANDSDKPASACLLEEIINEEMQEMADTMASIGVCAKKEDEVKDEESKGKADELSTSTEAETELAKTLPEAATSSGETEVNDASQRGTVEKVTEDQVLREDNVVTADLAPTVVDDGFVEPRGCMALSEEILAEEMQEVSDALASFGLVVNEKDAESSTVALKEKNVESKEVVKEILSTDDNPQNAAEPTIVKPNDDDDVAVEPRAVAPRKEEGSACLALSNEMLAEELQEVSEALVSLGLGAQIMRKGEPIEVAKEVGTGVSPVGSESEIVSKSGEIPKSSQVSELPVSSPDESNVNLLDSQDDIVVAAVPPQAGFDASKETKACLALSEEMLVEEIQEVSVALASLGLVAQRNDRKVELNEITTQDASAENNEKDAESREVTTSVSSGGCMPGGLRDVTAALSAIGIKLDSKKVGHDLSVEGADGNDVVQDATPAAPDAPIATNDCVTLSAEMVTEEIQEVSEVLGSFGITLKPDVANGSQVTVTPKVLVASEAPESQAALDASELSASPDILESTEKTKGTSDDKAPFMIAGCLSGGFDDVTEALGAIGIQSVSPPSSAKTEVKETACVELSEEMITEEIQEVSTALASLGFVAKDKDDKDQKITEPSVKPDATHASATSLSEEVTEVSPVLMTAGISPRKNHAAEDSVPPPDDLKSSEVSKGLAPNFDGFDDVATEAQACMVLSEEMFSEELQEVSEAIASLATGQTADKDGTPASPDRAAEATASNSTPPDVPDSSSPCVPREKSLVDDEEKPEADEIKATSTCGEFSEQVSATMASFGLRSAPPAEQRPKEAEVKPNGDAGDVISSNGETGSAGGKDTTNLSNDMLVESMAVERADCGCIVM